MREIKFRAWDINNKKMFRIDRIDYRDDNFEIREVRRALDGLINIADQMYYDLLEIELMQYTGLKDKNGTEIYEGDIFALEVPYIDFVIGETIYEKEYIPVTYESGSYVLYEQGIQEHNLHDVLTGWRIKEGYKCSGVVVGNIHEHKHLLEAE